MTNPTPRPALRKAQDASVHPAAPRPARSPRAAGSPTAVPAPAPEPVEVAAVEAPEDLAPAPTKRKRPTSSGKSPKGRKFRGSTSDHLRVPDTEHAFRLAELHDAYPDLLLPVSVPDRTAIQQAQGACVPVQAWRSAGATEASEIYDAILDVLLARAAESIGGLASSDVTFSTGTDAS